MLRTFGRGSKFWADYWQNVESGSSGSFPCLHHWCRWENHNTSLFHSPDIFLRYWLCFHRQRMSHQTDRAIYLQEVCGWAELMSLLSQNRVWATVAVLNIYMVSKTLSLKAYNLYNDHHCCLKTLFFDGQYNHNKVLLPWWPSIPTWHIFANRVQASPGALCSLCEEALPSCEERELRDDRSLQTHSHHLYNGTTRSSLLGRLHFIWRMKIFLSLMSWEDAVLSPPWADGFWQSAGELVGVGHGAWYSQASEEKRQYQHSECILCVCLLNNKLPVITTSVIRKCFMVVCLGGGHCCYLQSLSSCNKPILWGVSQSLFVLQNRDLCVSFSLRPNNTFCGEFRSDFFFT